MATYRAKCWLGSNSGYQELEVQANTITGANEQFKRIYGAEQIINCHEVRGDSSSSSSGLDLDSTTGLVILGGGLLGFFMFAPWVLMGLGGAIGTWIGEKTTNYSVEEFIDTDKPSDNEIKKSMIIFLLSIILGGVGFVYGDNLKKGWDSETKTSSIPAEVIKNEVHY